MESALEVLSRAATMVNAVSDTRLNINKELPTTKWRRDRRIRLSSEYHSHEGSGMIKPLGESNQSNSVSLNTNGNSSNEIPLDMTVTSVAKLPSPPPYREPLPGSPFLNAAISPTSPNTSMARPSVITQAPRREVISNQENKDNFRKVNNNSSATATASESISMVDPVIDEHFRRSLGADYMNLFGKKQEQQQSPNIQNKNAKSPAAKYSPTTTANSTTATGKPNSNKWPANSVTSSASSSTDIVPLVPVKPESLNEKDECESLDESMETSDDSATTVEMSVDDHFAKALGDTWKRLQQAEKNSSLTNTTTETTSANENKNVEIRKIVDNSNLEDNDSEDDESDETDDSNSYDSSHV